MKAKAEVKFQLPQFTTDRTVSHVMQVVEMRSPRHDIILGRDVLTGLGLIVNFRDNILEWDDFVLTMPEPQDLMKPDSSKNEQFAAQTWKPAKYDEEVDLAEILPDDLSSSERKKILDLIGLYPEIFNGKLGKLPVEPIEIELKPDAKPHYQRPYPIPRSQIDSFKKEVKQLVNLGVLKPIFDSPWGSPSFGVPKPNGTVL